LGLPGVGAGAVAMRAEGEFVAAAHEAGVEEGLEAAASAGGARYEGAKAEFANAAPHALLEGEPHAHLYISTPPCQSSPVEVERDTVPSSCLLLLPLLLLAVLQRMKERRGLLVPMVMLAVVLVQLVSGLLMGKVASTASIRLPTSWFEEGKELHGLCVLCATSQQGLPPPASASEKRRCTQHHAQRGFTK
jgi:hypothetical protein